MKIKTSELTVAQLDWAVAKCEGVIWVSGGELLGSAVGMNYSTDWAQGGPIIEQARITVSPYSHDEFADDGVEWLAILTDPEAFVILDVYDTTFEMYGHHASRGPTPLIAAMRCFAVSRFGNEVDIPEELTS